MPERPGKNRAAAAQEACMFCAKDAVPGTAGASRPHRGRTVRRLGYTAVSTSKGSTGR